MIVTLCITMVFSSQPSNPVFLFELQLYIPGPSFGVHFHFSVLFLPQVCGFQFPFCGGLYWKHPPQDPTFDRVFFLVTRVIQRGSGEVQPCRRKDINKRGFGELKLCSTFSLTSASCLMSKIQPFSLLVLQLCLLLAAIFLLLHDTF